MQGEIENWKNGWYGIRLALSTREVNHLIGLLGELRDNPEQHFHISSDYVASEGLGDIEISLLEETGVSNMSISGLALAPGDNI